MKICIFTNLLILLTIINCTYSYTIPRVSVKENGKGKNKDIVGKQNLSNSYLSHIINQLRIQHIQKVKEISKEYEEKNKKLKKSSNNYGKKDKSNKKTDNVNKIENNNNDSNIESKANEKINNSEDIEINKSENSYDIYDNNNKINEDTSEPESNLQENEQSNDTIYNGHEYPTRFLNSTLNDTTWNGIGIYDSCSEEQIEIIINSIPNFLAYRKYLLEDMENHSESNPSEQFMKWMKTSDNWDKAEEYIEKVNQIKSLNIGCDMEYKAVSYAYQNVPIVYVCEEWFSLNDGPLASRASKSAVLLHEAFHCIGADDIGYSKNAINLLNEETVENADSYRLWAEDLAASITNTELELKRRSNTLQQNNTHSVENSKSSIIKQSNNQQKTQYIYISPNGIFSDE